MLTANEISAEELARLFYRYHESLAADFECEPENDLSPSWELAPGNERKLMVATARLVLLELSERHPVPEIATGADATTASSRERSSSRGPKLIRRRTSDALGQEGKECGC